MDDLLALVAGEASVWARRHLEECETCRAELDLVYQRAAQLKALPSLRPARDRWPVVRAALQEERQRRRKRWTGFGLAAAAALAGVMLIRPILGGQAMAKEIANAKRQSAQLESTLQSYAPEGRVVSGEEAEVAARLEDQIAQVDVQLTDLDVKATPGPRVVVLWRQRVNLMQQLVQVRVVRAKYVGL
jgi:hypothetical protein